MKDYRQFTESELKWVKRLQRVMKDAPESLFMFIGAGEMCIYTKSSEGERYVESNLSMDQNAPSEHVISEIDMDGGDY
ncbi:MAG: hypothetical protein AAF927_01710 [Bacteroidota bacterium]